MRCVWNLFVFGLVQELLANAFPRKCANKIVHLCRIMVWLITPLKPFHNPRFNISSFPPEHSNIK